MLQRLFVFLLFILLSAQALASKCVSYREKYQKVQLKQKQAHSARQSGTLQKQELAAWQNWMDCKKGKLKPKKAKKKTQTANKESRKSHSQKIIMLQAGSAFESQQGLVVKGEYSGVKQQAWLDYYQPEKKCKRPKSTQTFAYCLVEKEKQQKLFEVYYLSLESNKASD